MSGRRASEEKAGRICKINENDAEGAERSKGQIRSEGEREEMQGEESGGEE